jgi:hypothetical protein
MSDVLARLMRWMETSDIDDADVVLRDAITEIAGLRSRLDERRRMPTLTDEEREAVHRLCRAVTHYSAGGVAVDGGSFARDDERAVAVVRGWLARLK